MTVSYNKLWKKLIDFEMGKGEFVDVAKAYDGGTYLRVEPHAEIRQVTIRNPQRFSLLYAPITRSYCSSIQCS